MIFKEKLNARNLICSCKLCQSDWTKTLEKGANNVVLLKPLSDEHYFQKFDCRKYGCEGLAEFVELVRTREQRLRGTVTSDKFG